MFLWYKLLYLLFIRNYKRGHLLTVDGYNDSFLDIQLSKFFFFFFGLFRPSPGACGCSKARGPIGTTTAGLHTPQPQQHGIWAMSMTYTTAYSNAGSLTHWSRPGIELKSSWILVRFINCWAIMGTLHLLSLNLLGVTSYLRSNHFIILGVKYSCKHLKSS